MAIDDVYYLQLLQRYAGQQIMNVLCFRMKTAADPAQATVQTLATDWKDFFLANQVSTLTHTGWIFQQIRGGTVSYSSKPCVRQGGLRYEGGYTGAVTGGAVGEGMPPQSAIVTTLNTGFSGRTRRGRSYHAGFAEGIQTDGTLQTTAMSNYLTQWNAQLTQFGVSGTDANFQLGVWSMRTATGCAPRNAPPWGMIQVGSPDPAAAYLNVTSVTPRSIVYSQRRRTIGVGR